MPLVGGKVGPVSDRETQPIRPLSTADDEGTDKWAGDELFTPGMSLLSEYGHKHAHLSREAFMENCNVPHIVVSGMASDSTPVLLMTRAADAEQLRREAQAVRIAPLTKRPGSNSFTMMITIGRTDNNDIVLKHSMISKFHAYFRRMGEKWTFCDAGSRNGTTLDGRRLAPERSYPVKPGSQIQLGGTVLVEYIEPAALFQTLQDVV